MIRITRLSDYGIVLLASFARPPERSMHNARDLATESHLPRPVVSKILKVLAREGLLVSHRGAKGGYSLARRPAEISVAEIIGALEGPIALTECSIVPGACDLEPTCSTRTPWQQVNRAIREALEDLSLREMVQALPQAQQVANRAEGLSLLGRVGAKPHPSKGTPNG